MSEYRQKIPGFVWPAGLDPSIRYLARDAAAMDEVSGYWFGFIHEPRIVSGGWLRNHGDDEYYGCDLSLFVLPCGPTPLLLCRDDYEPPESPSGTEARVRQDGAAERDSRKPYVWPKCLRPEIVAIAYDQAFCGGWWGYEGEPHAGESSWDFPGSENVYDLSTLDPSLLPQIDPADWKNSIHLKSECEVEP